MDQKLQTATKFSKSQFLKKSIQFLLKMSIFSFLCSYFPWPTIFLHSINLYSSLTFPHNTLDRNYMFLICIGILVYVARNSGLISSSHFETEHNFIKDEFSERSGDGAKSQIEYSEMMNYYIEKKEKQEEEQEVRGGDVFYITQGEEEEEEVVVGLGDVFYITQGEEEQENELSTEELNKKFDDFIWKMKETIRVEAQQLIMV